MKELMIEADHKKDLRQTGDELKNPVRKLCSYKATRCHSEKHT